MATFAAINTARGASTDTMTAHENTPTTPRPTFDALRHPSQDAHAAEHTPQTPTRHDFNGIPGQRPLPTEPFAPAAAPLDSSVRPNTAPASHDDRPITASHLQPDSHAHHNPPSSTPTAIQRNDSYQSSTHSLAPDDSQSQSQDVEMEDADEEAIGNDEDGSDNESVASDSQQPSKKKKGQRFFCKDFPPCQLSFTRSEHLARHIRKHTGERPFQCHCSRRFSRLDNLRQHAQTVHVNEEIPGDSLAATSVRYQRHMRTERVRPTSSRSRASTLGSQSGHARGHSRNLSTSSITSVASTASSIGGLADDVRRRPQPLAMAGDASARAKLSLETFGNVMGSPGQHFAYHNSASGYSTPTSTAFSVEHGSPSFQASMASPASTVSRASVYLGAPAHHTHARRLSVPSASHPFPPAGAAYPPPPYFGPPHPGQSVVFSPNSSAYASPTSSVFSHNRRESESEYDFRRRTWHPSTSSYTQRPATSGLTFHSTPDQPRPAFSHHPAATQAASNTTRLPGIESFDHVPPPAARPQSNAMTESSPKLRPLSSGRPTDATLHQGLTRLDITSANAPPESLWPLGQGAPRPESGHFPAQHPPNGPPPPSSSYPHPHHVSMPEPPITPRTNKRNAWYGGPISQPPTRGAAAGPTHRTSPEDSGSSDGIPTPSQVPGAEYHPVIVNASAIDAYAPSMMVVDEKQPVHPYQSARNPNAPPPPPHTGPVDPPRPESRYQPVVPQPSTPNPQTYALRAGYDPHVSAGAPSSAAHFSPPPLHAGNNMTKLDALVAVATSEGHRAVEHA